MISQRRSFLQKAVVGLGSLVGLSAFNAQKPTLGGDFVHVVYFWMKDPDNKTDQDLFVKNLKVFLDNVSVIRSYHIGGPAHTPRDIVDNSYSFALIVTFDDRNGHDVYQEHELHKAFITDTQHLWSKVQIYDSVGVS